MAKLPPIVINESLSGATLELVRKAARKFAWDPIRVRPLSRYGYSGARIFVISPTHEPHVPQILKIADAKAVNKELRAIRAISPSIKQMPNVTKVGPEREHGMLWAGLCYRYFDTGSGDAADLTDLYARCMNTSATAPGESFEDQMAGLLDSIFLQLSTAHVLLPKQATITYGKLFEWYLRSKRPSRVDHVLQGDGNFHVHGAEIRRNPLAGLGHLLKGKTQGFQAVVIHGDLHLSNIVIDESRQSNLIDFAWARGGGHLFIDYALLESSLRFMSFPHDIYPELILSLDRELNADMDGGDADRVLRQSSDALTRHRLSQMLAAVLHVRSALKQRVPHWTESSWIEYQRTVFLLLSGQQRLASFPLMRTIVNLDYLGKELDLR